MPSYAESEAGKIKYAEVLELSNTGDIQGLMRTLPELELLWNEDPKGYMHTLSINLLPLVNSKEPAVIKVALSALPRVIEKKCPSETERASFYFSLKNEIIGEYLRIETIRSSSDYYLMVADFLTEIRSRKIKGYRNQFVEKTSSQMLHSAGVPENGSALTEEQKKLVLKATVEDKEKDEIDRLQKSILTLERGIIDTLVACAPSVNLPKEKKTEFYRELAKRANLTAPEKFDLESSK